jgi:AcrR family transcriptional regulator
MTATDLRDRQRAATREQIIQAVHDVLTEEHPATLSMPQVATRAGIGLRTLYRYFPTKEALVDAASETWVVDPAVVGGRIDLNTIADYLRAQWRGFTASIGAIRAQHATPAGRAMRESRLPRHRQVVRRALDAEGVRLPRKEREQLVDLITAIASSSMYLELVDRMGRTDDDAADLAAWVVGAVIERAKREGAIAP